MSDKYQTISLSKANRLYWLGRYAQRVYLSLHFMRRFVDELIDGRIKSLDLYCSKLSFSSEYDGYEGFVKGLLYDEKNQSSIISALNSAYDNAIVLREEIKSESFSYIQLSLSHIQRCKAQNELNVTELQPVTDYMLAFFGCMYERVCDLRIRDLINIGRHVESLDMHLRFDYPWDRIAEICSRLEECRQREAEIFSDAQVSRLRALLTKEGLAEAYADGKVKQEILGALGGIVRI